jgi:hypothetical protein
MGSVAASESAQALKGVKFFDLRNGWAVGNASALYPVGRVSHGGRGAQLVFRPCRGGSQLVERRFRGRSVRCGGRASAGCCTDPTARGSRGGSAELGGSNRSLRTFEYRRQHLLPNCPSFWEPRVGWLATGAWCCRRRMAAAVGRLRRSVCQAGWRTISISRAWPCLASGYGSSAIPAPVCFTRRTAGRTGRFSTRANRCRCARSSSWTLTAVGRWVRWERSWQLGMAGRAGRFSGAGASGRRG